MLLSMTGYGAGQATGAQVVVTAEIRAVNNRYLKLNTRLPDGYAALEPRVEERVRSSIRRGSVQLNLDVRRESTADDYQINPDLVVTYAQQLKAIEAQLPAAVTLSWEALLSLPGVIQDTQRESRDTDEQWPVFAEAIDLALEELRGMRTSEGEAMAADIRAQLEDISRSADAISTRAPTVVEAYELRLQERIAKLLNQHDLEAAPADILREVGIFAERADISEEIVRLRSHLDQFAEIMSQSEAGAGRKLDFLVQELLRETNTVGSKANDAEIARHVVHTKTCIERIREMVQNIE